jgi:hypothetical protein
MLHLNTTGLVRKSLLLSFILAGVASCSDNESTSLKPEAGGASANLSAAEVHEASLVLDAHADIYFERNHCCS